MCFNKSFKQKVCSGTCHFIFCKSYVSCYKNILGYINDISTRNIIFLFKLVISLVICVVVFDYKFVSNIAFHKTSITALCMENTLGKVTNKHGRVRFDTCEDESSTWQ